MKCPDCGKDVEIKTVDGVAIFNCICGAHGGADESQQRNSIEGTQETRTEKGTEGPVPAQATGEQIAPATEPASGDRGESNSPNSAVHAESDSGGKPWYDVPLTDWLK